MAFRPSTGWDIDIDREETAKAKVDNLLEIKNNLPPWPSCLEDAIGLVYFPVAEGDGIMVRY